MKNGIFFSISALIELSIAVVRLFDSDILAAKLYTGKRIR